MKMQIWEISVVEGTMGAIHGHSYRIYEGYVPDLKLSVNHVVAFVNDDNAKRYKKKTDEDRVHHIPLEQPDPKLICEVELSRAQIEDMKQLADQDGPHKRSIKLIASTLIENGLKAEDYED